MLNVCEMTTLKSNLNLNGVRVWWDTQALFILARKSESQVRGNTEIINENSRVLGIYLHDSLLCV